jgi:hypothetical protein
MNWTGKIGQRHQKDFGSMEALRQKLDGITDGATAGGLLVFSNAERRPSDDGQGE